MVSTLNKPTVAEFESTRKPTVAEFESSPFMPGTVSFDIPEEPEQLRVWEPGVKERVKNAIGDMARRSPFIQPGKRLGQLGLHHLSESVSGIGLYIPDILASKITQEDTLASAIDKITGFEPTPRDVGAGEAAKFITSLQSVGKVLGPAIKAIPARQALKTILGSGLSFGGRKATEEVAKKISTGKPIDVEGIYFEGGIGVLFGTGEVGVSKFANWIKNFRALPKAQIRPARAEVNAALKHYQKTGDRARWDAVRIKYAGIKPEGVSKIKARQAPPTVEEFGKYPITKAIKRLPTEAITAPQPPRKAITAKKAVEVPPKAEIERPTEKLIASFSKYQKAMPNATEQEVVEALVKDGLRPPKDMLRKYEDLPAVAEIIEQDRIDEIIKRQAPSKPAAGQKAEIPPVTPEVAPEGKLLKDKIYETSEIPRELFKGHITINDNNRAGQPTVRQLSNGQVVVTTNPYQSRWKLATEADLNVWGPDRAWVKKGIAAIKAQPPTKAEGKYEQAKKDFERMVAKATPEEIEQARKGFAIGAMRFTRQYIEPKKDQELYNKIYSIYHDYFEKQQAQPPTKAEPAKPKGKPGFVDLTPIADAGQQIKTTGEKAAKVVTRFGGLEQDVKKTLIEYEEQMKHIAVPIAEENVEFYGHLTPKEETAIMNHRELPDKYPLPENLKSVYDILERRTIERGKRLEELGYTADWPNQYRARLEKRLAKLEAREEPDILAIEMVEKAIEEAKGLRYLHHYYKPQPRARRILSYFKRRISRRPSGLLGRKIPTLEKAKELGLEPAPLAVSEAHADYSMARAEEAARLIKAINENPNLSQWADDAPEGWVFLDQNIFPESVQKLAWVEEGKVRGKIKRRKYPVPIAEALAELTYVRSPHLLTRWYDKFNFAMKMIGFYNPLVMSKNDLVQGWRAAGVRHLPKLVGATNTFIKKGPKYDRLRRGGLFNNVVSWTPSVTDLTQTLLDKIRKTWGQRAAAKAGEYLNPLNIIKTIRKFNDATTWNMDEIMRIATYDAIRTMPMTRGMTDFDVIELANDFMVNYAKLPKATKEHLSRVFFVPTYRIGNFRVWFGKMLKHPWRYKGPILRTVSYKMFIAYGLPALVSAAIFWMTDKRRKNIRTEKGYRLVIPNPETGKDTVYSLSDPLLEGAKITQRVIPHTFVLNLAAMPSLLLRLASGPRFRNPRDPYGEFFKLGTPIYRDIVNWTDPDKTVPQKILSQLVIAYTYQRKMKPTEEDKKISAAAMAKALSIWTDWKEHKKELEKTLGHPIYRWMTTEELQKSYEFNTISVPYKRRGEPFRPIGAPRKGAEQKVAKLKAEAKRRGIELKRGPRKPPRR